MPADTRPSEVQSPEARLALAQLEIDRLETVIARQAADKCEMRSEIDELRIKLAAAERQTRELDAQNTQLREDGNWLRRANDAFEATFGIPGEPVIA